MPAPTQPSPLLTGPGQQLLDRLRGLEVTPDEALRLGAELRADYPPDLVAAALTQQALRVAAKEKFSRAQEMYLTRPGLEQASGELTAAHSAERFAGPGLVADLCCGIGGDLAALARVAGRVLAVDADQDTLRFAGRNAAILAPGASVTLLCADVRHLELGGVDAVFIDPARRTGGRRLRTGDSQPPLDWCFGLTDQVPRICIKAAPGLAHEVVPAGWELEFVATGRALKEALLWSPAWATTARRATVLPASNSPRGRARPAEAPTLIADPGPAIPVADPGAYLLDPNPAITRAGLVQELGRDLGCWQIDPLIAFLSCDRAARSPFARTLRVLDSAPWHEKQAARRLRELGIGAADIRRRGLAGDVEQIHRRLRLQGDKSATIVLTRRDGQPWGLICEALTGT